MSKERRQQGEEEEGELSVGVRGIWGRVPADRKLMWGVLKHRERGFIGPTPTSLTYCTVHRIRVTNDRS